MRVSGLHALVSSLVMVLLAQGAFAQGGLEDAGTFDVTSVKRNTSGRPQMVIRTPPSGLDAINVNVRMLIRYAYQTQDFLVVDGPAWTVDDHFDVRARTSSQPDATRLRTMIKALLVDRFALKTRAEQRVIPVDLLTRSRAFPGPHLHDSTECPSASPRPASPCGMRVAFGRLSGRSVTIAELAASLTFMNRRVMLDRTGLVRRFDLGLEYTPDALALMEPENAREQFPAIDPAGPSLKTALREQLGLNLDGAREPVEVIVVDRISPPAAD